MHAQPDRWWLDFPTSEYHGAIEYDPEREVVRYRTDAEIESILDSHQEHVQGNGVHVSI